MSSKLDIDLSGIEHKFSRSGEKICADCGRDFDDDDPEPQDEFNNPIPLMLWKDGGRLMLVLCWPCATKRFRAPKEKSFPV